MASESIDANAWGIGGGEGAAETLEQNSHQQTQEPSTSTVPQFVPGESLEEDDEDSGEYDPESVIVSTTVTPAPAAIAFPPPTASTSSPRPAKKPKKAGGFIVGSSDDEDDDTPTPQPATTLQRQVQPAGVDGPTQTFTHLPLQQAATSQNVPVSSQVSTRQPNSATSPTDIVGILEDRVNNDPRGDMDAWLALIEETRKRSVIQNSRSVYERFLEIFPQSVSHANCILLLPDTC